MTQEAVAELMTFVSNSTNFHLLGVDPSHLQLCWNNIMYPHCNTGFGGVARRWAWLGEWVGFGGNKAGLQKWVKNFQLSP